MIPENVRSLFAGRVFWMGTADAAGMPNVAPMLQSRWTGERTLVIGDMLMKATSANVRATGKVCLSAYDPKSDAACKLTGTAVYETAGADYDFAQAELEKRKPGKKFKGVVVFTVQAAYDQARGPNAGALIWSDAS